MSNEIPAISGAQIVAGSISAAQLSAASIVMGTISGVDVLGSLHISSSGNAAFSGAITVGAVSPNWVADGALRFDTQTGKMMVMLHGQWCEVASPSTPEAAPQPAPAPEPAKVHFKRKLDLDF